MYAHRAARPAPESDEKVIFNDIMQVKRLREQRLRRQLLLLNRQQQQLLDEQQLADEYRRQLTDHIEVMLGYTGIRSSSELVLMKQQMAQQVQQEQELASQQQARRQHLHQIDTRQQELMQLLRTTLKSQEKLQLLIADEYHYVS